MVVYSSTDDISMVDRKSICTRAEKGTSLIWSCSRSKVNNRLERFRFCSNFFFEFCLFLFMYFSTVEQEKIYLLNKTVDRNTKLCCLWSSSIFGEVHAMILCSVQQTRIFRSAWIWKFDYFFFSLFYSSSTFNVFYSLLVDTPHRRWSWNRNRFRVYVPSLRKFNHVFPHFWIFFFFRWAIKKFIPAIHMYKWIKNFSRVLLPKKKLLLEGINQRTWVEWLRKIAISKR